MSGKYVSNDNQTHSSPVGTFFLGQHRLKLRPQGGWHRHYNGVHIVQAVAPEIRICTMHLCSPASANAHQVNLVGTLKRVEEIPFWHQTKVLLDDGSASIEVTIFTEQSAEGVSCGEPATQAFCEISHVSYTRRT